MSDTNDCPGCKGLRDRVLAALGDVLDAYGEETGIELILMELTMLTEGRLQCVTPRQLVDAMESEQAVSEILDTITRH